MYKAANRSARIRAAYDSDLADFADWTADHGFDPLLADPAVVALHLTERPVTLATSTLNRRMAAISIRHQDHGLDSPTHNPQVRAVLTGSTMILTPDTDIATLPAELVAATAS